MGGAADFFLTIEFNYVIIRIKLCRCVEHMVAASSSSSKDDMSLCAIQEKAPAPTRDAASSSPVS